MSTDTIEDAFDEFNRVHDKLVYGLNLGKVLGDWGRREVSILGWDIRDCIGLLIDLHERALEQLIRESEERNAERPIPRLEEPIKMSDDDWLRWFAENPPPPPDWERLAEFMAELRSGRQPTSQLAIAYKTAFFLIRSYQDAVARVLRFTLDGVGSRARMSTHLKAASAVGVLGSERLPKYGEWYWQWVKLRDQVKYGAEFALTAEGQEVGVIFVGVKASEGSATVDQVVFLRDIGVALRQSAAVAEVAIQQLATTLDVEARLALASHVYP